MEQTLQKETEHKRENQEAIVVKQTAYLSKPAVRTAAVFSIVLVLAAVIILTVYAAGMFDSGPELPEIMEGDATFISDDGNEEVYRVIIDYKKKLVHLTSLGNLAYSSESFESHLKENKAANRSSTFATKIVLQDYNTGRKYFIVPGNGKATTKCIYTGLDGDMIPKNLLQRITSKSVRKDYDETVEENYTRTHFQVDNNTEVDVYRAKGHNGKIYEVYFHLPNGTIHMRSKENETNFTDHKQLNCYKYIEENGTVEETFFESNDSKLYKLHTSTDPTIDNTLELQEKTSNFTQFSNETTSFNYNDSLPQQLQKTVRRRRRGIGWRNGSLDWWYGNWCGYKQGGYTNKPKPSCKYICQNSTSYVSRACRTCLPPQDPLDEACMEHDRCIKKHGRGPLQCQPIGNRCKCDRPFVKRVYSLIHSCPTDSCRSHALQVHIAFQLLSCWYPQKTCFPSIRFRCSCVFCLCPRITVPKKCIIFKKCALLGSGNV